MTFTWRKQQSGKSLLLDIVSGSVLCVGLVKLKRKYTGKCLRVRRSSDNAEQDIGFVGTALDTTTLLAFVGAGNGFVTTWYDQSGSGFNLVQTTAASQPMIVSGGSYLNYIVSNGSTQCLYTAISGVLAITSDFSYGFKGALNSSTDNRRLFSHKEATLSVVIADMGTTSNLRLQSDTSGLPLAINSTTVFSRGTLCSGVYTQTGSTQKVYRNAVDVSTTGITGLSPGVSGYLVVGSSAITGGTGANVSLTQVTRFNKVLSAAELSLLAV
jgi:hypothetical protein